MSLKTELDQSNLAFFEDIQLDHSHGAINKTPIMTAKQNKIEIMNKTNLNGDIL